MTVLKQILVVLAGVALAAIMSGLGVWQLHVYDQQGRQQAQSRAAAAPVSLVSVAPPGEQVGDAYGRRVRFTGSYDPGLQVLLPVSGRRDRYRVVTAFRLRSGGAVAVVRGLTTRRQPPTPPTGQLTQIGVLLPSEGVDSQADPSASPTTLNLAALAQRWSPRLVNGYATLTAAEAQDQSLLPAAVELPTSGGRLRNGLYALQWWVFAAFAVLMAGRMARDLGREQAVPERTEADVGAGDEGPDRPARDASVDVSPVLGPDPARPDHGTGR